MMSTTAPAAKRRRTRRRTTITAGIAFATGTTTLLTAGILWTLFGFGLITAQPSLPPTELDLSNQRITTMPYQSFPEADRKATIYTRNADWKTLRAIIANDVNRHGGWHRYDRYTGTHFYLPADYLKTFQELLDLDGIKPYDERYTAWAQQALERARQPANEHRPTADTHVVVQFAAPMADLPSQRMAILILAYLSGLSYAVAAAAMVVHAYHSQKADHAATASPRANSKRDAQTS